MDVNELRDAFNSTISLKEKVKQYKKALAESILEDEMNELNEKLPTLCLIALPSDCFEDDNKYTVKEIKKEIKNSEVSAFERTYNAVLNIDNVNLKYIESKKENLYAHSYIARFKTNGIVEYISNNCFEPNFETTNRQPVIKLKLIRSRSLYAAVEKCINDLFKYYSKIDSNNSIIITGIIVNAQGYTIPTKDWLDVLNIIDRRILFLPDIEIEKLELLNIDNVKPLLDSIWNSCGYEEYKE